jgi:sulfoxide reductase heme-binding subunit YedZ
MFLCAAVHAGFSLIWFHAYGNILPLLSLFLSNTHYDSFIFFPFQTLGFFAFLILMLMAFTSHDFWLNTLSPRIWKSLHMLVYLAYALLVLHVALGVIQLESSPVLFGFLIVGLVWLCVIHLTAARKEWKKDYTESANADEFIYAGRIQDIPEKRALVVNLGKERAAIFSYEGKLSAVSNVCKHQNGPLGEGKIIDGCITCPWHGYQYQPQNGCAPPPFTEKIATYKLKLDGDKIFIHPDALPEGTAVEPLKISHSIISAADESFYIGWQEKASDFHSEFLNQFIRA